jgi:murein DD-endopeptidase MepM/ murein hydrolase activator NlpD
MKHRTPNRKSVLVVALLVTTLLLLSSPIAAVATPAAAGVRIHVVQRGENLTSIAALYGVSISAIMQANGISDANRIYFGQRLTIPSGSSSAGTAYTSSAGTAYTGSACAIHVVRLGDYLGKILHQRRTQGGDVVLPPARRQVPHTARGYAAEDRAPVQYQRRSPQTGQRAPKRPHTGRRLADHPWSLDRAYHEANPCADC